MGGMVTGLLTHTIGTATSILTRNRIAPTAAINIWNGTGINAQNIPSATASEQERRFICHNDGSCRRGPSSLIQRFLTMTSGCGRNLRKIFRAMIVVLSALIQYSAKNWIA